MLYYGSRTGMSAARIEDCIGYAIFGSSLKAPVQINFVNNGNYSQPLAMANTSNRVTAGHFSNDLGPLG